MNCKAVRIVCVFISTLLLIATSFCGPDAKAKKAQEKPAPFPSTDIIVISMRDSGATFELVGKPVNITNRKGYDNQPSFMPNGKLLSTLPFAPISNPISMATIWKRRRRTKSPKPRRANIRPSPWREGGGSLS